MFNVIVEDIIRLKKEDIMKFVLFAFGKMMVTLTWIMKVDPII